MADTSHKTPKRAVVEEEDSEWEYEYHDTETEVLHISWRSLVCI